MNQNLINLMLDLSNFGYEYSPTDIKISWWFTKSLLDI